MPLFRGWYVVAASFVILFAGFGTAYSFGAFFEPLSETFGASRTAVSAVFSWTTCAIFLTGAVSGMIADRFGPRPIVAFGVLAIGAGFLVAARAESLRAVQLGFALGVGIGVGCAYVPAVGTVQRWFHVRRGLASGIAVSGIGLGMLVLPLLAGLLLTLMHWRSVFLVFAVAVIAAGLAATVWLAADPADHGLTPDGIAGAQPATSHGGGAPLAVIVRSRAFLQLYVAQTLLAVALFMPFVHIVPTALDAGVGREAAVLALGMVGLGSTLGRFLMGALADRLGRLRTMVSLYVTLGASFALWWRADTGTGFAVFALIFGTCYGGYVAMIPALLADYFAGRRLSSVIGLQYTAAGLSGLVGPIMAGWFYDHTGSYGPAFAIAAATTFAGAALLALLPAPRPLTANPGRVPA